MEEDGQKDKRNQDEPAVNEAPAKKPKKNNYKRAREDERKQLRAELELARKNLILLAREHARTSTLLKHYMDTDDTLFSSSQLDYASQASQGEPSTLGPTLTKTNSLTGGPRLTKTNSLTASLPGTLSSQDLLPSLSQELQNYSQVSNPESVNSISDILSFLDRHDKLDLERLEQLQEEVSALSEVVRVGVGTLLVSDKHQGCVLVGTRKNSHGHGTLQLPGGHLEFGEELADCAKREVMEETGLAVNSFTFQTITNDIFLEEGKHYITIFMLGHVGGDQEPQLMEPDKCEGWEWKSWQSLKKLAKSTATASRVFTPLRNLLKTSYSPFH